MSGSGLTWFAGTIGNIVVYDNVTEANWVARYASSANFFFRFVLTSTGAAVTNALGFYYDTLAAATLTIQNIASGTATGSISQVTVPSDATWHRFTIRVGASAVEYLIDGASLASFTANRPTGVALTPHILVGTRTGGVKTLDLDLFWLKGTVSR